MKPIEPEGNVVAVYKYPQGTVVFRDAYYTGVPGEELQRRKAEAARIADEILYAAAQREGISFQALIDRMANERVERILREKEAG
jgi:hypothetical protein